jgi:hypothetical protein
VCIDESGYGDKVLTGNRFIGYERGASTRRANIGDASIFDVDGGMVNDVKVVVAGDSGNWSNRDASHGFNYRKLHGRGRKEVMG